MARAGRLDGAYGFAEVMIGEGGNGHADGARRGTREGARQHVRHIADLLHGRIDGGDGFRADLAGAVEYVRDGRQRYVRRPRYIFHGGHGVS
ncbi:hypothetical protein D3C72_1861980 [compost metagenome]